MALRFIDSADHYATADITRKWTSIGGTTPSASVQASGRNGGSCLRCSGAGGIRTNVVKTLDAQASWVIGFAFRTSAIPTTFAAAVVFLQDAGSAQCDVRLNTDGTLSVTRNGTALTGGTSTLSLSINAWYYVEFKVTIANSIAAGSCKVRVNGVDWITVATAQDTQATANATANQFGLGVTGSAPGGNPNFDYDDVYVLDGTASTPANNDFLGDVRVEALFPSGAGSNTTWDPSAGANWECVNETTPNDDTDYVSTATVGERDTYVFGDLSSTPVSIYGVQTCLLARKTDGGIRTISDVCKSGATTSDGATRGIGDTYLYSLTVRETDPATTAAWTETGVNAGEFGSKLIS